MTRFSRDSCVFRGINTDEIFKYLIQNRFILEEIVCGLKREKGNRFVVSLIEKKKKTISLSGVQNNSKAKRELHDSVRKPKIWVPTRSNTNRAVQSQKMVTGWKFWI